MAGFTVTDTDERVFILNNLELLTAIFRGPDAQGWISIFDSAVPQLLEHAAAGAHLTASLRGLQDSRPSTSEIVEDAFLETEYVRLFVAAGGGVVAPLYESCHLGEAPRIMGDSALSMQSRLAKAGLEVALSSNEPADHLSIELEYLYHQLATAWSDEQPTLEAEAREFARCDMLPWIRRFRHSLAKGNPPSAYLAAADLLVGVLERLG